MNLNLSGAVCAEWGSHKEFLKMSNPHTPEQQWQDLLAEREKLRRADLDMSFEHGWLHDRHDERRKLREAQADHRLRVAAFFAANS
jgi:hypothetical protein